MTVKFKQIKDDKDISEKEGFGTMVLSSFVIVGLGVFMIKELNANPFVTVVIMLTLAWLGRLLTRKLFGDYAKKSDIIGELTLGASSITWTKGKSNQILTTSEVASFHLKYNYVQGRQFAYKDIIHNGLAHLSIQTKSNQTTQVKFLIETEQQLKSLAPIWKEYYRQKIKIKESMGKYEVRTILFKKDSLSFDQMQELKKELNVDSFY